MMSFSNTGRLVPRFLFAAFIGSLIHAYVLWNFLTLGATGYAIIVGEAIGVIAGLLIGLYWTQYVKKKIERNTLYYSKKLNIILGIGAVILIIIQVPFLVVSIVPNYLLPYIALPFTLSISLGAFGVALWAVQFEREHGPLYVKPRN